MTIPIRTAAMIAALSLLAVACGGDDNAGDPLAADNTSDAGTTESEQTDDNQASDEIAIGEDGVDAERADLLGAGATFITPVMLEWIRDNEPGIAVNYQSIGSGGGIEQFLAQTVDFGSSERYLDDETLAEAAEERGCEAIQFPVVYGAVTLAFHDEELDDLILDAEAIAGIFQREVTTYDDPVIAELNPDRDLPDTDIIPVHRSDGSGTTSVFTTYLEDAADGWELGSGTEVQWPSGTLGGQGNEGVTAQIEQNPGGVGYVNQAYALENDLPSARVVNADGNPVKATLEATSDAVETIEVPDDFQFDILGVGGEGFPIAGTNWIFAWECGYDDETAELLEHFWNWALSPEADELALELQYAPLGDGLKDRVRDAIERINSAE